MSENELHSSLGDEQPVETIKTKKAPSKKGDSVVSGDSVDSSTSKRRSSSRSKRRVAPSALNEGVKFRLTFLMDQSFKGTFYRKGESLEVEEHVFKAYKGRVNSLQFERL